MNLYLDLVTEATESTGAIRVMTGDTIIHKIFELSIVILTGGIAGAA